MSKYDDETKNSGTAVPELLGLQPERAMPVPVLAGLMLAVGTGLLLLNSVMAPAFAVTAPTRLVQTVDPNNKQALASALGALRLTPAEVEMVRAETLSGAMQIGMVSVVDWARRDGDVVSISSGGFVQRVTLQHWPTTVAIPYVGTGEAVITAEFDGGGGVTVMISGGRLKTRLKAMAVGESTAVPLP